MSRLTSFSITTVMTLCALLLHAGSAMAQDETRVAVLKFETFDVEQPVMDTLYSELERKIQQHPEKTIATGGEVTINEMIVTIGCEAPTPDCLIQLADFIEADQILFGTVQRSEDIHLFTIKLFDFSSGEFETMVEDQTVQGDEATVSKAIPALIDSLLYGDVGELVVDVTGADGADIFFDGEKVGKAPTGLKGLPLGEHVVTIKTADGKEQTKKVLLQRDKAAKLNFNFGAEEVVDPGPSNPPNFMRIGGYGLLGVGVVSAGVGVSQFLALRRLENEAANEPRFSDGQISEEEEAFAKATIPKLQEDMNQAYTRTIFGLGIGGISLATGALLLVVSKGESDTPSATHTPRLENLRLDLAPTRGGGHAGLSFSF